MSILSLELCGGVILAKLLNHLASTLEKDPRNVFAWTDGRVVLGWLRRNPRRVKTVVGNRIAEISGAIPVACWYHVDETNLWLVQDGLWLVIWRSIQDRMERLLYSPSEQLRGYISDR